MPDRIPLPYQQNSFWEPYRDQSDPESRPSLCELTGPKGVAYSERVLLMVLLLSPLSVGVVFGDRGCFYPIKQIAVSYRCTVRR